MVKKKCFVVLLGSGSAGKTTSRQSYCGEPERMDRYFIDDRPCFITYYKDSAVAGNHNSGSDANASPALIVDAAVKAFETRDVVFFDGVMGSPRLLEITEQVECSVLLVKFDISQAEIERRLMQRRRSNGIVENELPEKTRKNSIMFSRRAENTLKHFTDKCQREMTLVKIVDTDSTRDIVEKIRKGVDSCLSTRTTPQSTPA